MYTIIQGVSVFADPALPRAATRAIALELIQTWNWEGRALGKIELIYGNDQIHVQAYEKPFSKVIPWKNRSQEE